MAGISFIVTVYNKAPFLPLVLAALFAQEGDFDREIVIIDDGSTDGSFALLEALCAGRPEVRLLRQRNAGPAVATNAAVREARLPWLKIVDADDVLAPWCTRLLLDAAAGLGAGLALGGCLDYRLGEALPFPAAAPSAAPRRRDLFAECLLHAPCNLSPTLIDRAAYWAAGGCDERIFTQDYSLLLRLSWRAAAADLGIPVCASPVAAPGRVSDDVGRMLRDTNLSLLHFLEATPGLPRRHRRILLDRAFGRAWKWQHRRLGRPLGSRYFWLYALAKLGPGRLAAPLLPLAVAAFGEPAGRAAPRPQDG